MPSSWAQIPKELLEAIFDQIEEQDFSSVIHTRKSCLFQLMLTCKHWSSIVKEAFYNEQFTLDEDIAKKLISDKPTRQLPLKNIAITYELANNAALMDLLSLCPDVTSLYVREWSINVQELSYIQKSVQELSNIQKSFYASLYIVSRNHHLAKLRNVEFELQETETDLLVLAYHQQAMLQLKHSLTHLQIVDGTISYRQHNVMEPPQRFVEWFDQLQKFPRLTTVKVNVGSLTYLYEMDRFIQKMGPAVTNINISMDNTRVLQPLKRINPAIITRRSSTSTLELEMAIIRAEDLNYIMHKFDKLSELKIAVWSAGSNEGASLNEFRSDDSLKRFFEYLTRLSKYFLSDFLVHNSLLRQVLMDLKKCFQVKCLELYNVCPTMEGTSFSIQSMSRARDGHRGQVNLYLEIGTAQLLSVARLVYEVLNEDVVELKLGEHPHHFPCPAQGIAVQLGIDLLPLLKTLTATNPEVKMMKSLVNPKSPKLAMDLLELGHFTRLDALLQMSQRIKHIESWVAPDFVDYDKENRVCQNYVLNMPFTTFGKICIVTITSRCIVKLNTSSKTTFHGVDVSRQDRQLPTEDDYYQQDAYYKGRDEIGKITIVCADVKRLRVANTWINIQD